MAKSMRSKREKRLRAIRREMIEPFYDNKDAAKLAAQEAALNAPKLAVKPIATSSMEVADTATATATATATGEANSIMDMEMDDGNQKNSSLKPLGGVRKQSKRQFKVGKRSRHGKGKGKGKVKRRHI